MLGKMSNLHLNLAIQFGVNDPDTELAAYLCSIQVDFAKHGRCIKLESMTALSRKIKGKPGFLCDEEDADPFETDHVI